MCARDGYSYFSMCARAMCTQQSNYFIIILYSTVQGDRSKTRSKRDICEEKDFICSIIVPVAETLHRTPRARITELQGRVQDRVRRPEARIVVLKITTSTLYCQLNAF